MALAAEGQFLLVAEAASQLGLDPAVLREGIACGLIPGRQDNQGRLRVHLHEVLAQLQEKIRQGKQDPALLAMVIRDEIAQLKQQLADASTTHNAYEQMLEKQSVAIERSAVLLETSENNTRKRGQLLERAMSLLQASEQAQVHARFPGWKNPSARLSSALSVRTAVIFRKLPKSWVYPAVPCTEKSVTTT